MPNWTTNVVSIKSMNKEILEELKCRIASEDTAVDFNNITPMPQELSIEAGGNDYNDLQAYCIANDLPMPTVMYEQFSKQNSITDMLHANMEHGRALYENIKAYQHLHWYDWCIDNWGVKWNTNGDETSVEIIEHDNGIYELSLLFNTAWNAPYAIFEDLSCMLPEKTFLIAESEYEEGFKERYEYSQGMMINAYRLPVFIYGEDGNEYMSYEDVPDDVSVEEVEYGDEPIEEIEPFQFDRSMRKVIL